jgi:hypothetical protein
MLPTVRMVFHEYGYLGAGVKVIIKLIETPPS